MSAPTCATCEHWRHWRQRSDERGAGDCAIGDEWEQKYPFVIATFCYFDESCDLHTPKETTP